MADLAYDASDPASSEPAGIALQQANRPSSSDRGKLRVFISYSRDDLKFADQLDAALNACSFDSVIDRHGISGGEEWKPRLGSLISEADTVVFVLSPTSARSPVCAWEVEEATRLGKRILPVTCRSLEGVSPPPQLGERNYIFFYDDPKVSDSGFGTGLANLVTALNTDFDWLRDHTRYLQRAIEWDTGGRPANRLLSGDDIAEAKAWVARRPKSATEPTALHLDFIRASEQEAAARLSEQRKQLEAMAAAQAERETALHKAEEAQRKRATMARIRNIALVAVSILALLAVLLGLVAERQWKMAEAERRIAENHWEISNLLVKTTKRMLAESLSEVGGFYATGVARDYVKARESWEKAADQDAEAMSGLGWLYANGLGVAQDYAKAHELFEKAADKGDTGAMTDLGALYANGDGVPQDYAKAREWYEKAAAKGDADAKTALERLSIREAAMAGQYDEALRLEEAFAAKVEAEETTRDGKPGQQTAGALQGVAWAALFAKDYTNALSVADRAHALFPNNLGIETNRAHALMFMGRDEEAKALYLAHRGEVREPSGKLWEQIIAEDFADFRRAGLTTPMMADIEKELGISR
jgi:TPR repeat protein